jgi:quinol monooxygenase YgiN
MRPFIQLAVATAMMSLAATPAVRAQDDPTAYMVTYLEVVPAAKDQGATILKQLAEASRKEAGATRFEVLQRTAPSNQFLILEVWKDKAAMEAHGAGAAAKQYREKMQPISLAPIDDRTSIATSASASALAPGAVVAATHVDVAPPNRDKTVVLLKAVSDAFRKTPGNLRYDVLQQTARTNHFTVVEVWKDQAAADAHELAAATKEYRKEVGAMLGALYDQRWYKAL